MLMVFALGNVLISTMMDGRFSGRRIEIRSWMVTYNTVCLALHLLALALLFFSTWLLRISAAQKRTALSVSLVFTATAIVATGVMLFYPIAVGSGPWAANAFEVRALRFLVFFPCLARSAGWGFLVFALSAPPRVSRARAPQRLPFFILPFIVVDLFLGAWKWFATPKAVTALLHPNVASPVLLAFWLIAGTAFLFLLNRYRKATA
jgi:hypothetical protein